ncbi:hypothetical protein NPIL_598061 [Nephila pilipes]|uniref:Uncharacterized protein n=1 Tax=Nephila pilipes TaxID=299642 RepID=A0A8X6PG06_NEPPI|nr:hypothetical protein NPIL_598061 [Nephila pilipes]
MVRTRPRRVPVRGGSFQPVSALAAAATIEVSWSDAPCVSIESFRRGRLVTNRPSRYRTNDFPFGKRPGLYHCGKSRNEKETRIKSEREALPLKKIPASLEIRRGRDSSQFLDLKDNWLILPVVICLSQRLSHARVSTSDTRKRNCKRLIR